MFDQAVGLLWPLAASVFSCTLLAGWLRNYTFSVFFLIIGLFCCVSILMYFFKIERGIFLCNTVFTLIVEC